MLKLHGDSGGFWEVHLIPSSLLLQACFTASVYMYTHLLLSAKIVFFCSVYNIYDYSLTKDCWNLFWNICTVTSSKGRFHHSVIICAGPLLHYSSSLCRHRLCCYCTQIGPIFSLQEALRMVCVYESPSGNTRIVS